VGQNKPPKWAKSEYRNQQHVDVAKERLTAGGVPDLFHSAVVEARGAAQSPRMKGASIDAG